jgi:hypothetical protein
MIWGAISYNDRSRLLRIHGTLNRFRYINEVLDAELRHFLNRIPGAIFQQDNARPHVAREVVAYFNHYNIPLLPWPARSPDLSPIEHVWDIIGRQVRRNQQNIATEDEMWVAVERAWTNIPQHVIQTLFDSMPRRLAAVINARGGYTRY